MALYRDEPLKVKALESFSGGYNSFTGGKSTVNDDEFPYGNNVILTNNGSIQKMSGYSLFSDQVSGTNPILGLGWLYNTSYNKVIAACGTTWQDITLGSSVALTGKTFTAATTHFCQAVDRLYGANGTDALSYTTNGSTIVEQADGMTGNWPTSFGQRLYMTSTTYPDRIYYSNPTTYTMNAASGNNNYTIGDFGTFTTDLNATPKKNAGFIILMPGSGVTITRLFLDNSAGNDYLYAYTKRHGIWRIAYAAVNTDGSIAHTISKVVTNFGTPSGDSVEKVGNDQWFFGGANIHSLGEVAQYQNIRVTSKSGRIRNEIQQASREHVISGFFLDKLYVSYRLGTYNDRMFIYDTKLNAWSAPIKGVGVNCFLEWEDSAGTVRWLAGLSDSSYVVQLESGKNFNNVAVEASCETKSTDCDRPGLIKRIAFADVFYTSIYGALTYEVFLDETSSGTGTISIGQSDEGGIGIGSQMMGEFDVANEMDDTATIAELQKNNNFRIYLDYQPFKKISIRFINNNTNESFIIDSVVFHFIEGDINEVL